VEKGILLQAALIGTVKDVALAEDAVADAQYRDVGAEKDDNTGYGLRQDCARGVGLDEEASVATLCATQQVSSRDILLRRERCFQNTFPRTF
jgi:hypothetical protein